MALSPAVPIDDTITTAVRSFLLAVIPANVEVFQGQANRVPEPVSENFVMFTPRSRRRLATNQVTWPLDDPAADALAHGHSTEIIFQLDLHGPLGADMAQTIGTLWRDEYACQALASAGIQPLFANDGNQLPFINGEHQYENRWVMEIALQASPIVSTPQDFAATLAATIEPSLGG